MRRVNIPNTKLETSIIGLGTMTWGEQNTEAEGHQQMDLAIDRGVNLIDTAEMYPVPSRPETSYETERIIGTWLNKQPSSLREDIVLATKATGPGAHTTHIRNGEDFDRKNLEAALHGSLERLQTDYIDLYQLHWPSRPVPLFGTRDFTPPRKQKDTESFESILSILSEFVEAGKIRYIGISNETAWGTMQFLQLAKNANLPTVVTIQNSYNLLNRTFDSNGLSEICYQEGLRLLAYSPLAFGKLSGKYRNNQLPEGSRLSKWERFARYNGPNSDAAIEQYAQISNDAGLDLAQMSLAWINQRFHVASNLIGATTMEQLKTNIESADLELTGEVRRAIEKVHHRFPNPCP